MKSFVHFKNVDFLEGFWKKRYELNKEVSVPNVKKQFEVSGRFDAMRFNYLKNGKKPHFYYDSDVAKWIEAIAYLIIKDSDSMTEQEAFCDELIDAMEKAQRDDGYLNSTHQQIDPHLIFKIRDRHELYCAGHLIEAAIAYHIATGKDKFLKIMERNAECIYRAFISEKTAAFTTPGHEEIELALFKLYRHTKNPRYFEMAKFFLEARGNPNEQYVYKNNRFGTQDDTDIYNLKEANGHSVRALYFYSGIADLALVTGNIALIDNLNSVFDDIAQRKMYITGGVGSTRHGEGFTVPYDLPNNSAYSESCCAIAMMLFASRMRKIEKKAKFGHVMERVLYNSLLSSTSLDGKRFFYENPLEIALEEYGREVGAPEEWRERLPITQRVEVFSCSCCPPNINRFFSELGSYILVEDEDSLTVEQYISIDANTSFGKIKLREDYAKSGKITISSNNYSASTISLRAPEWSRGVSVNLNGNSVTVPLVDGYLNIPVASQFNISIDFKIAPMFISSNPNVRANVGRVALCYGPLVYCIEKADNGERLNRISVDIKDITNAVLEEDFHGFYSIKLQGYRLSDRPLLYFAADDSADDILELKFIPYFAFANRGESDMQVWVRRK
ncbi:MAG: glycoside hydrolase family 127 protein [Clostridia bacterium]|nr:glycoside hydrolase family 127 protein [Clostridia bacterium]